MRELLIIFGCYSLLAIPCIFLFVFCGATKSNKLTGSIIVAVFWILLSVACWGQNKSNQDKWNNGYCECGQHWELASTTHYRNTKTKYYVCSNCYTGIELNY